MTIRRIILFAVLSLSSVICQAQNFYESDTTTTDVTSRVGFSVDKPFGKGYSWVWEEEMRFKENSGTLDRIYSEISLYYRFNEYAKMGGGYNFMSIWHDGKKKSGYEKYWDLRHRAKIDLVGNYEYLQWKFTLRERGQVTVRTDDPNLLEKSNPEYILRSKFGVEYAFFNKPLKPYYEIEVCNTLNAPDYAGGNYINSIRNQVGLKWRLDRRNSLEFYYRFDIDTNKDVEIDYKKDKETIKAVYLTNEREYMHILGVAYKFDWR